MQGANDLGKRMFSVGPIVKKYVMNGRRKMMKYDFESIIERRKKDALAVDGLGMYPGMSPEKPEEGYDFIPMWVADMNFATAPSVTAALRERIEHPLYGYFVPEEKYYDAIIRWQETHHQVSGLTREAIGYENGVHGCITSCVETFTRPGESIFLHTPFYMGFSSDIQGLGRVPVYSELKKDEEGVYRMDFADMDKKLKESNCHFAIMCSPHNPSGRVWERWELEKAMEIFEKNQVLVISDEIWADIVYTGHSHIPTQMVSDWARENTIAIYAPSKTFNLAGMIGSYHIVYNEYLRHRLRFYGSHTHYNEQNVLSMHALLGAYSEGGAEWTAELIQVLEQNTKYLSDYLNQIAGVSATRPQGTYMVFADFTKYCANNSITIEELLNKGYRVGVGWQPGAAFGGNCHIRFNAALPFSKLKEACARMDNYIFRNH